MTIINQSAADPKRVGGFFICCLARKKQIRWVYEYEEKKC